MGEESAFAVLHITTAAGGGADRYIRDIAKSSSRQHYALHVGSERDVLEDIRGNHFAPLRDKCARATSVASIDQWLELTGIGIVHLHGVDRMCRRQLAEIFAARSLPYVVTLHDLMFVNPLAFDTPGLLESDGPWIDELRPTLLEAKAVIVSSHFIADLAEQHHPGTRIALIPPGIIARRPRSIPDAPREFVRDAPKHVVAIVGAVGPHKGSGALEQLTKVLDGSDIGFVVIGYTDTQLTPGWVVPKRLYVHGAYTDDSLAGWLAAYNAEVALFPNRLPESFSYTLSEVWAAGLPAIVPNQGALGERVERFDGGWRLGAGFDGDEAAALLNRLFSADGEARLARVKSSLASLDVQRIPTLEAMARDVDALYERYARQATAEGTPEALRAALEPLLAVNLDGFTFRKELINLTGEVIAANKRLAEAQHRNSELENDVKSAIAWGAKLEQDVATTKTQAEERQRETEAWVGKVEHDARTWAAKLESDIETLKAEINRLGEDHRLILRAFRYVPKFIRKHLLQRALGDER